MSEIFSLYQPDMFDWLRDGRILPATIRVDNEYLQGSKVDGRTWLTLTCNFFFAKIAEDYGCDIRLSAARLEQAHRTWLDDVQRIRLEAEADEGYAQNVPNERQEAGAAVADHFKQAAHLAYWLRRRLVTNSILPNEELGGTELQSIFTRYGNEICSFRMGLALCIGFQTRKFHPDQRRSILTEVHLDHSFVVEIAKLLHYKNVSPQSLYLIYKSLFFDLGIPDPTNVVALAPRAS